MEEEKEVKKTTRKKATRKKATKKTTRKKATKKTTRKKVTKAPVEEVAVVDEPKIEVVETKVEEEALVIEAPKKENKSVGEDPVRRKRRRRVLGY